jgi:hypothetical protein
VSKETSFETPFVWLLALFTALAVVTIYLFMGKIGLTSSSVQKIIFMLCFPIGWLEYRIIVLTGLINRNTALQLV